MIMESHSIAQPPSWAVAPTLSGGCWTQPGRDTATPTRR